MFLGVAVPENNWGVKIKVEHIIRRCLSAVGVGLLATLVAGCPSKPVTTAGVSGHKHESFLPIVSGGNEMGWSSLTVVDSDNPSHVMPIDALDNGIQVFDHGHFHSGTFDKTTFKVKNFHMTTLMYAKSDGFFRLDLAERAMPYKVQVSSEPKAATICHETMVRGNDFVNQDLSRLVYKIGALVTTTVVTNGVSTDVTKLKCDGNTWHLIRLGMAPSDAPLNPPTSLTRVIDGLYHEDTGALIGWIAVDNGKLTRYDADFALARHVATLPNSVEVAVDAPESVEVWTRLADRKSVLIQVGEQLLRYNPLTDQASVVFSSLSGTRTLKREHFSGAVDFFSDGAAVYFFSKVGDMASLNRLPLDTEAATPTVLTTENEGPAELNSAGGVINERIGWIYLTKDQVAYVKGYPYSSADEKAYADYQVKMVHKTNGSAAVTAVTTDTNRALTGLRGVGDKLYLFSLDKASLHAGHKMRVISDANPSSGGVVSDNLRLVGETYSDVFDPTQNVWALKTMILQKERRLIAYDPVLEKELFDIGQLSIGQTGMPNFAWSRGHQFGLLTVASDGSDVGTVYYFDADVRNSLVNVGMSGKSVNHKPSAAPRGVSASSE